jgi:hypothetical protein
MGTSVSADSLVAVDREPSAVRRGAALLAVEAVALVVVGIVDAVATVTGEPTKRGLSFAMAGLAVAAGILLLLLARAVARRQGWARSPAVVLQLLAVPVGIGLLQGGVWAAGIPVLALAALTLVTVLAAGPDPAAT